jgi:hypothetical protein
MKRIKKKTMSKRVIVNRILFWTTNIIGAILCVIALINVFSGNDIVNKIAITAILSVVIPIVVVYAKTVYTFECNDWKPLSD